MWQVVGQTKAIEYLERSLEQGHPAHAYLIVGPPQVGKATLALGLAQRLNCLGERPPCGECLSCRRIAKGKHTDVQVIGLPSTPEGKKKTEISIDQIRGIQSSACLPPYEGKHKVFILDGAEYLSTEASNSLLKILEEPPPGVFFLLLASREGMILPTVASRCQRIELAPSPREMVRKALEERWKVEPERAEILSRLCQGCMGWAISAGEKPQLLQERQQRLEALLTALSADLEERFSLANRLAVQFSRERQEVLGMLALWRDWWRDLMLFKAGLDSLITNVDQKAVLEEHARGFTLADIWAAILATEETKAALEINANPRLALEVLLLRLPRKDDKLTGSKTSR